MAKNLIPEIARMLGVELNEEFKVVYKTGFEIICNFTKEGVFVHEEGCSGRYNNDLLTDIICGKVEIVKLPWKPKKGENYYTFELLGDKWGVGSLHWDGFPNEYALLDKGWVYRSQAEAEDALPKVAAEMGVEININRELTAVEKAWLIGIVSQVLLEEELKELQEQLKGANK